MIEVLGICVQLGLLTCCVARLMIEQGSAADLQKVSMLPLALATKTALQRTGMCRGRV